MILHCFVHGLTGTTPARKIQNKSQPTKPRLRNVWASVGILTIELDATSVRRSIEVNLKLHFKFHNIEHEELQSSISLGF